MRWNHAPRSLPDTTRRGCHKRGLKERANVRICLGDLESLILITLSELAYGKATINRDSCRLSDGLYQNQFWGFVWRILGLARSTDSHEGD